MIRSDKAQNSSDSVGLWLGEDSFYLWGRKAGKVTDLQYPRNKQALVVSVRLHIAVHWTFSRVEVQVKFRLKFGLRLWETKDLLHFCPSFTTRAWEREWVGNLSSVSSFVPNTEFCLGEQRIEIQLGAWWHLIVLLRSYIIEPQFPLRFGIFTICKLITLQAKIMVIFWLLNSSKLCQQALEPRGGTVSIVHLGRFSINH